MILVQSQFLGKHTKKKIVCWLPTAPLLAATLCLTISLTALSPLESRFLSFVVTRSTTKSYTPWNSLYSFTAYINKKKSLSNWAQMHCIVYGGNLCLTLEIRFGCSASLSSGGECVGVKKKTPLPPQGINNIHSYRGDRWETALPLPHKPYLLLQLFNFATPTPPFLLFGVHAWRSAPCASSLPLRYMHLKRLLQ